MGCWFERHERELDFSTWFGGKCPQHAGYAVYGMCGCMAHDSGEKSLSKPIQKLLCFPKAAMLLGVVLFIREVLGASWCHCWIFGFWFWLLQSRWLASWFYLGVLLGGYCERGAWLPSIWNPSTSTWNHSNKVIPTQKIIPKIIPHPNDYYVTTQRAWIWCRDRSKWTNRLRHHIPAYCSTSKTCPQWWRIQATSFFLAASYLAPKNVLSHFPANIHLAGMHWLMRMPCIIKVSHVCSCAHQRVALESMHKIQKRLKGCVIALKSMGTEKKNTRHKQLGYLRLLRKETSKADEEEEKSKSEYLQKQ